MNMKARKLNIGTENYTQVFAEDDKGPGGANHSYSVRSVRTPVVILAQIFFQHGPIKENGVNGIQNEDLLAIVIDRLEGFQSGDFACEENAEAKEAIELALSILQKRTQKRKERGVEGTSIV